MDDELSLMWEDGCDVSVVVVVVSDYRLWRLAKIIWNDVAASWINISLVEDGAARANQSRQASCDRLSFCDSPATVVIFDIVEAAMQYYK